MSILNSIFFGLIQGFSEFFPISSGAHLTILGNLMGVSQGSFNFNMYSCFVHLGTIIAAFIVFWDDFADIIYEYALIRNNERRKAHYPAVKMFTMILISCIPLLAGLLFFFKLDALYASPIFIGVALLLNGTMLFVSDHFDEGKKDIKNMVLSDALIIGFCQVVAIFPGISRIGATTCGGMAIGYKKDYSLKYACIMSVPVSFCATVLNFIQATHFGFEWSMLPAFLIGMAVSILSGIVAIKIMQSVAKSGKLHGFAYYCWVAGVLAIILTMIF